MTEFRHPFADDDHLLLTGPAFGGGSAFARDYRVAQAFLQSPPAGITAEAWVYAGPYRAEAVMPLVAVWEPLSSFDTFSAHDAEGTDGLPSRGFFGAVFDGRYVYGCPSRTDQPFTAAHGGVLRFDTHGDFKDSSAYQTYDAGATDGLSTRGFYGGAFDGRYVYFNPRDDGGDKHSRFLRYDTRGDFKSATSWQAFDAEHAHTFQGCAFDGRYLYCCPGYTEVNGQDVQSGALMRLDTQGDFKSRNSYQVFDTTVLGEQVLNYDGACYDGRHVYFAPLGGGQCLRHDPASEFGDPAGWETFDARAACGMGSNVGAVFAGHHIYYCSYNNSTMVRYDTRGDFAEPGSWSAYEAADTEGLDTGGFDGGFFDGRYVYFIPFTRRATDDQSQFHGNYLRYDTAGAFEDAGSWSAADAAFVDGLHTTAFNGGATDGRYLYAAPWRGDLDDGRAHARILRYDTLGENGAFSLRYSDCGHNGGLCAAVPGPTFLVNTTVGVRGVSAHRTLEPGWHYLAGVYDGTAIQLVIDGEVVAQREATGAIQPTEVDVAIGHIAGGVGRFGDAGDDSAGRGGDSGQDRDHDRNRIAGIAVSAVARSGDWMRAAANALRETVA